MNKKDRISALFLFALGAFCLYKALQLPVGDIRAPDTAFWPVLLCGLLMLSSMILFVRSFWFNGTSIAEDETSQHWKKKLLAALLVFVAYCFLLDPLGYIISTVLMVAAIAVLAGCSWKEAGIMALICAVASYFIIVKYLKGPLPMGILPF